MTILMNGFTASGSARVTLGWSNGPGWFERPVSVSGTAVILDRSLLRRDNDPCRNASQRRTDRRAEVHERSAATPHHIFARVEPVPLDP